MPTLGAEEDTMADILWPDRLPDIDARNRGKTDKPGQDTALLSEIRQLLSETRQLRRELRQDMAALDYEQRSLWTRFKSFFAGGV